MFIPTNLCLLTKGLKYARHGLSELTENKDILLKLNTMMSFVPGHSAVDGKVEGIEETDDSVDNKSNVAGKIIVHLNIKPEIF